jgi:hypothetical protein
MLEGVGVLLETADIVTAIDHSADARTARTLLARAVEAHPQLASELVEQPLVRDGLIALACASRSLSSAVIADDTLLDPLRDRRTSPRAPVDAYLPRGPRIDRRRARPASVEAA